VGELLARVRVALRTSGISAAAQVFSTPGLEFDFKRRQVKLDGRIVNLSGRESQLLRLMLERRGQVVVHREIILAVWGDLDRADSQFVRVLAGQLRHKIEADPSRPRWIVTVPGLGYQFGAVESDDPEVASA
jgi:two-component system KDP operon response regulator KdpE